MAYCGAYSPPAAVPPFNQYDVFISFNGRDTRNGFTSHLHSALCKNQIETFIDYRIEKGGVIWEELVQAIQDSTVLLVIFSEHYASSKWCLRELAEIMECKNMNVGRLVIPVFYRIEPTHVRKQTGSYHTAFAEHERYLDHRLVRQWRTALSDAANISGFEYNNHRREAELIDEIVETILRKLNKKYYTNELGGPFIRDQNFTCIESLLRSEADKVLVIGIWGMGGIGKTTIAATLFNEFSSEYKGCCFLANSRELERQGSNHIYDRLLSQLLNQDLHIDNLRVIPFSVIRRLKRNKVFIVLDDMSSSQIVADLVRLAHDGLKAGSRVILTTRDRNVLTSGGVEKVHEVREMNDRDSLKLFSLNAFDIFSPKEGYYELSIRAVAYAKGVPLALKVLGSFLRSKGENEWNSALKKLTRYPHADIQRVLRLSYDGLDDEERSIFLDIACFFKGHKRGEVTRILNSCGFCADIGIRSLLDKALIISNSDSCIKMHDLIQDMCREIVREESSKRGGVQTRIWDTEEACNVLQNNREIDAVESIIIQMNQIAVDPRIIIRAFRNMPKLRLLALDGGINMDLERSRTDNSVLLPSDFKCPDNLRYIQWNGCPLKSLPLSCWSQKLVQLSMQCSRVQKLWDSNTVQNLPSLEAIDLGDCTDLIECPNFSGAPNLKYVKLNNCESLPTVHSSIFSLPRIKKLDVRGCKALRSLYSNYCSPTLQFLWASSCSNLEEFSVPMVGDHPATELTLSLTALSEVPSNIVHLRNLYFGFPISYALEKLPENFAHTIILSDPKKHEDDACIILSRILSAHAFLFVRYLQFFKCRSLSELPDNISELRSLKRLSIRGCHIVNLPKSIKYLQQLEFLEVVRCKMLQYLPPLPPSIECLRCTDCISLETVSGLTSEPPRKHKAFFLFHNCTNLDQHAYEAILKDLNFRIELGARTTLEQYECSDYVHNGNICYYLPSKDIILDWFPEYSTQALVSIEVPPDPKISCLAYYLQLSQYQSCNLTHRVIFRCECYLETGYDEWVYIASSSNKEWLIGDYRGITPIKIMSDHVLLWCDVECCKEIMEAIQETHRGITYNCRLKFEFSAQTEYNEEVVLKKCGIRWIYLRCQGWRSQSRWL